MTPVQLPAKQIWSPFKTFSKNQPEYCFNSNKLIKGHMRIANYMHQQTSFS